MAPSRPIRTRIEQTARRTTQDVASHSNPENPTTRASTAEQAVAQAKSRPRSAETSGQTLTDGGDGLAAHDPVPAIPSAGSDCLRRVMSQYGLLQTVTLSLGPVTE